MNSSGGTETPSRHQRTSASTPVTREVASSTTGWNSTANCCSVSARCRSLPSSSRRMTSACIFAAKTSTRPPPRSFARVSAMSALRISSSAGDAVLGEGDADAGGEHDAPVGDAVRLGGERPQQPLAEVDHGLHLGRALHEHRELVTAPARDRVVGEDAGAQPAGRLGEDLVAAGVADGVVDRREPVEVDEDDGDRALATLDLLACALFDVGAVGQAGQPVVEGQVGDLACSAACSLKSRVVTSSWSVPSPARPYREIVDSVGSQVPSVARTRQARRATSTSSLGGQERGDRVQDARQVFGVHDVVHRPAEQVLGGVVVGAAGFAADVVHDAVQAADEHDVVDALGQRAEVVLAGVDGAA